MLLFKFSLKDFPFHDPRFELPVPEQSSVGIKPRDDMVNLGYEIFD